MTDTTHSNAWAWQRQRDDSVATTGPDNRKRRAPVFIHDAVTPWGGETLLLSLLRQQALDAQDDDQTP